MLMEYDQTNIIEYVPFDRQIFPWTHHDPIPIFWFDQDWWDMGIFVWEY